MVFEKIRELIAEQFSIDDEDEITLATDIVDDLNADSLDVVDLMMSIEEEFGLEEIPEEELEELRTVGAIVEYIEANS
ncbi:MAG: acyl carrier protein [Clostridia bacterium]|nr:acyl carrier protein [Clostridia bacterium]